MKLALFDLDGTLLPLDTNHEFGQYLASIGWVDPVAWRAENDAFLADHHRGELDLHKFIDFATAAWRDRPHAEVLAARDAFVARRIVPFIPAAARALVKSHQDAGDLVALVTGTNEFLAEPIASVLGFRHLLSVELERDEDGRFNGRIKGIPSFHAGKVDRVHAWLAAQGRSLQDFETSTFYGDSVNDIPVMEEVTEAVAVNPSEGLLRVAADRGWRVMELR